MYLQLHNLDKSFGQTTAVQAVSLTLDQGDILCLLGPSGCGKTTLLRLIAGLDMPDNGTISQTGRDITRIPPHKRGFGMMFQDYALFPHKNVFDNIAFGLTMRGDTAAKIDQRVNTMLDLVELQGYESREIAQLSGGEQQRVALARALAPDPPLLLLDEPLGALDRFLRERLMIDLRTILKRVNMTAVYVTHDQTEAFAIGDKVAVMNDGRIEQIAPPQTLYTQPNSAFVARFLGFHNIIAGTLLDSQHVMTPAGTFALPALTDPVGSTVQLLIKPTAATFATTETDASVPIRIDHIGFYGRYFRLTVTLLHHPDTTLVFEDDAAPFAPGQTAWLTIDPAAVHRLS